MQKRLQLSLLYPQSSEILLNLRNAETQHLVLEFNYSNCTDRSSENICRSSGGAQEKGKTGCHSVYHQNWWKN